MSISETGLIQLQILLDNAGLIDSKYQEGRRKNKFNIFNILAHKYDEVNLHSKFIFELLNPKGSHGCGKLFLKQFLLNLQIENFNIENVAVLKEHCKIDLLIVNDRQAIVIENKLLADDQPQQLENYYNVLSIKGYQVIKIIYLSLDKKEATQQSIGSLSQLPH